MVQEPNSTAISKDAVAEKENRRIRDMVEDIRHYEQKAKVLKKRLKEEFDFDFKG